MPDGFDCPGAQVTYTDGTKELRSWTAAGDLLSFTPRFGTATTYTYDALHRKISRSGSWAANYGYNLASHPLSAAVANAADGVAADTGSWGYDTAGRMNREVQPAISAQPVRYDVDLNGLRDSTYWPDGAKYYLPDNYNCVRIGGELTLSGQAAKPVWKASPTRSTSRSGCSCWERQRSTRTATTARAAAGSISSAWSTRRSAAPRSATATAIPRRHRTGSGPRA